MTEPDETAQPVLCQVTTVRHRWLEDELILYSPVSDELLSLDGVGARVWFKLDDPMTADELAAGLAVDFNVESDVVRRDIEPVLSTLRRQGFLLPVID